jgi:filamentous hemagglutinin family protein
MNVTPSRFALALALAISGSLAFPTNRSLAQIVPDATLGSEPSVVTPNVTIRGLPANRIDGGAARGANLFHSFSQFNILDGQRVYFANPTGIENILTRVTGSNISHILGTLGVDGPASLFLLNPNGIIFGPNARLDIAGSFLASTAESVVFSNGFEFTAKNPQAPPLLTVSVPLGLQYRTRQPGAIANAGNLAVQPGQNITLVGGTVATTGQLRAPGGQISVAAVPGESLVQLAQGGQLLSVAPTTNPQATTAAAPTLTQLLNTVSDDTGLTVTPEAQVELKGSGTRLSAEVGTVIVSGTLDASNPAVGQMGGTVQVLGSRVGLFDTARINVSGDAGGGTALIGGNYQGQGRLPKAIATYIAPDVTINADALGVGNGGQIVAWANDSTRVYGTLSAQGGTVAGNGGVIETSSQNFLDVSGIKVNTTAPLGVSGTWLIDPRNIIIQNSATTNGTFSGGNPNVFTPGGDDAVISTQDIQNQLNGGTNVTITTGSTGTQEGNITVADTITKTTGGVTTLRLEAANNITFNSGAIISSTNDPLNVVLSADSDRSGAGDVVVFGTGVDDVNEIQANGGNINITANSLLLDNQANFHSDAFGSRNGGQINVKARTVLLRNGSGMGSNTSSEGKAGGVTLTADTLSFENYSGLSSETTGSGNAGQITLNVGSLSLNTGGFGTNTTGSGNAGQININADTVALENTAGIGTASGGSGNAGQINVKAGSVSLKNSAFSSDTYGDGNAGQINVEADSISLTDNSVFVSSTSGDSKGNGGQVTLKANSVAFTEGAGINTSVQGSGKAGRVSITANTVEFGNGGISTETQASGEGGTIAINAGSLTLKNSGFGTNTIGSGDAGRIIINADTVALENSGIGTATGGTGNAGQIDVKAGSVSLKNSAFNTETLGDGNAGPINVEAGSIFLTDRSAFSSNTSGQGKGGQITLKANSVALTEGASIDSKTEGGGDAGQVSINADVVSLQEGSALNTNTFGSGNAGQIRLNVGSLSLNNSTFSSNTTGSGDAGQINITADTLTLVENSGIGTATAGSGNAGQINVNSGSVSLNNSAFTSDTRSDGNAGQIKVEADSISLSDRSAFSSNTLGQGNGGQVTLTANSVALTEDASISTKTEGGGDAGEINVEADAVSLENGSLSSQTSSTGNGGQINLKTRSLSLTNGAQVSANTSGQGNAGDIFVTDANSVLLNNSSISSESNSAGTAGEVMLNTQQLTLENGAKVSASTVSSVGGSITLSGLEKLQVNNSLISASTQTGTAGNVTVNATDSVQLRGTLADGTPGGLRAEATAGGNASSLRINTRTLSVSDGASATVSSTKSGSAGNLEVTARDVLLNNQAKLTAETEAGSGGNIMLEGLNSLRVNNSMISASTQTGTAGNLTVNATDSVQLAGRGGLSVEATNGGTAGNLTINTRQMTVRDGANVTVSSPTGVAGNLSITANEVRLNRGTLSAETGTSGAEGGANITLKGLNLLLMSNESLISANAAGNATGGNITIDSQLLVALPPKGPQGSDIVANAFKGNGGRVNITTSGLLGIKFRPIRTPKNDITASSDFGAAGQVNVNQLAVDPSQGLGALPQTLVDVEGLINQDVCKQAKQGSAFTVTGRGGTPENPKEILSPEAVVVEWATQLAPQQESNQQSTTTNLHPSNLQPSTPPGQLVEAQGWIIAPDGTVILTANPPNATPHATGLPIPSCQSRR